MSRIPPGLLYLTIYNPSIRPAAQTSEDDEDAEEQAQILFYTARERAVSRDRILRQVGLAKALVTFSEMFNAEDLCENVHSQARRMIMLSPEPSFWIHACLEVAKTPRPAEAKSRRPEKGKGKENKDTAAREEVTYDYHDGSVHDLALRSHILLGYELFKLTHGTFASILSTLGQNALELQLERFFTVWAWKWDIDEDTDFGAYLGAPLHPLCHLLIPVLDEFLSQCPEDTVPLVLTPPSLVPSTRYSTLKYPACLIQHISTHIPPPLPGSDSNATLPRNTTLSAVHLLGADMTTTDVAEKAAIDKKLPDSATQGSTFLAMPNMNLKWNWPGYLTFSKGSAAKGSPAPLTSPPQGHSVANAEHDHADSQIDEDGKAGTEKAELERKNSVVDLDTESLQEAMSTDSIHMPSSTRASPALSAAALDELPSQEEAGTVMDTDSLPPVSEEGAADEAQVDAPSTGDLPHVIIESAESDIPAANGDTASPTASEAELPQTEKKPLPSYLSTTVHLSGTGELSDTRRKRVWHLTSNELTFALVTDYDVTVEHLPSPEAVTAMLYSMRDVIAGEKQKVVAEASIPSATKILQPQDRHIVSAAGFTRSSSCGLSSETEQLFNCQQMLQSDLDVLEVFSRGQNPQHWHISKCALGVGPDGSPVEGEVYMQIARKESTLTDVDNELAGVVRRFLEQ